MKKLFSKLLLFIVGITITLSPFAIFFAVAKNQKHVYSNTYYAALVDKVHYLESLQKEKKIILIGGSNVAFGFNSQLIEEEFPEYKVVNFGLYAMLGTKIMMDLAVSSIGEGDIVFLSPEINTQSTSLYFDGESTLKAIEDDISILKKLPNDNRNETIGSYLNFVKNRSKQKDLLDVEGVYQRKNFEKHGDIHYEELDDNGIAYRSRNRMALHYDPTMLVDYSYSIDQSFYDYVNSFNAVLLKKKANLFYSFSPVNEKAVINKEDCTDYYWNLRKNLSCNVIGNPIDYILDAHYFYDSNFHLNDDGAIYRTYLLLQDIYRDVLKSSTTPKFSPPEKPPYVNDGGIHEDSETAKCFKYNIYEDSLIISGVKDEYLSENNLLLPEFANGKRVVGIDKDAFKGCSNINNLVISNNINILMDGCFGNCLSLKKVYISTHLPGDIIVSYDGKMTEGVVSGFKIYLHSDCFDVFSDNYYWGNYVSYFERY